MSPLIIVLYNLSPSCSSVIVSLRLLHILAWWSPIGNNCITIHLTLRLTWISGCVANVAAHTKTDQPLPKTAASCPNQQRMGVNFAFATTHSLTHSLLTLLAQDSPSDVDTGLLPKSIIVYMPAYSTLLYLPTHSHTERQDDIGSIKHILLHWVFYYISLWF